MRFPSTSATYLQKELHSITSWRQCDSIGFDIGFIRSEIRVVSNLGAYIRLYIVCAFKYCFHLNYLKCICPFTIQCCFEYCNTGWRRGHYLHGDQNVTDQRLGEVAKLALLGDSVTKSARSCSEGYHPRRVIFFVVVIFRRFISMTCNDIYWQLCVWNLFIWRGTNTFCPFCLNHESMPEYPRRPWKSRSSKWGLSCALFSCPRARNCISSYKIVGGRVREILQVTWTRYFEKKKKKKVSPKYLAEFARILPEYHPELGLV